MLKLINNRLRDKIKGVDYHTYSYVKSNYIIDLNDSFNRKIYN